VTPAANRLTLTACLAELDVLRYTPAGVPALNLRLDHESTQQEAGQDRQVKAVIKALAFGANAERLAKMPVGSMWIFQGFLATPKNGKHAALHIQEFQQVSTNSI
jgi:primosomal replication protein N